MRRPDIWHPHGLQGYSGAVAEVGDDETAFSHRDALVEFVAVANWTDPAEDQPRMSAARRYAGAVEPFTSGVYVNALGDEGEEGVQRAYSPGKLARLAALKDRYDPENVFHLTTTSAPARSSHGDRPDLEGLDHPDAYQRIVSQEVLPGIAARNLDGYHGAYLLRRDLGGEVEFATIMLFDSLEQVRGFAGEDYESAYVPPKAGRCWPASTSARPTTTRCWARISSDRRRRTMEAEATDLPKLPAPARRALLGAGHARLEQLTEGQRVRGHAAARHGTQGDAGAPRPCGARKS